MTRLLLLQKVESNGSPIFKVLLVLNKTISDGGLTVDFWFIKVHTSN